MVLPISGGACVREWMRGGAMAVVAAVVTACGGRQPGRVSPAAADSAAAAARRDSVVAAAQRDSLAAAARRDSAAAAARADSIARAALEASRPDSVRAEVLRDAADDAALVQSGLDSASALELASPVFFEFDRYDLSEAAIAVLDRKLGVLQGNQRLEIQVAGHCDERGSDEYNLALSGRRAAAVKRYLVEHGVAERRIAVMAYGEERPLDSAHTEESWARNRRAEFVVTTGARR